jgi:hypothetical protein
MLRRPQAGQGARATSGGEISRVAADAYIFGYPLVLMDATRQIATATAIPTATRAPTNCFAHLREFPDPSFTSVVSPDVDTLYSVAWLDLTEQPVVLRLPDMGRRYYLMQCLDAWTNVFAAPGTRSTGGEAQEFAFIGPDWTGTFPPTLPRINAPTNMVWIIGRTETKGPRDLGEVHGLQEQYRLTPLSEWGTAYRAPIRHPGPANLDLRMPPVEQLAQMDARSFFDCFNMLMKGNPPSAADKRAMDRFASIGLRPGSLLDDNDDKLLDELNSGVRTGRTRLLEQSRASFGVAVNGWEGAPNEIGRYGTNYLLRSAIAMVGLGANLREDAICPRATADRDGKPLNGANRYTITFPKGATPPVNAFWSMTMYDDKQTFVENPIKRYAIGSRDDLLRDANDSLTILIQHERPAGERERNWLPAPPDAFNVMMRLYWPSESILSGRWTAPPIQRVPS